MSIISDICECTEQRKFSDLLKQAILRDSDRCYLNVNFVERTEETCDDYSSVLNCTEFYDLEESGCCLFSEDECGNIALNILGDICNVCG